MLKLIPKDCVELGMFVESVQCPSIEFRQRRFLLRSRRDLLAIQATSATHVLINLTSGIGERQEGAAASNAVVEPVSAAMRERVREVVDRSTVALRSNLEAIAKGGRPELAELLPVAKGMATLWCDNTVVALEVTRLKAKDLVTYTHSLSVGGLMSLLGTSLELDEETVSTLGVAGIVHDIGKLLIPHDVLMKPGKLTADELKVIREHPETGYQLLKAHDALPEVVLTICRLHHEMLDGSGYPFGLKAPSLDMAVRISTVCDVFDALTTSRPYKRAWSPEEALDWMYERPHAFDRKLVIRLGSVLSPRGARQTGRVEV